MDWQQKLTARIKEHIQEIGWSVISVFPTADQPGVPFTYSIGFTELGHPEIIIVGVSPEIGHGLIGSAYDAVKDGAWFADGDESSEIINGDYNVIFRAVPGDGQPANAARAYYEGDIKLLQMIWPDREHRYPWEEGYNVKRDRQPILAEDPTLLAGMSEADRDVSGSLEEYKDEPSDHCYVVMQDHGIDQGGWGPAALSGGGLSPYPKPIIYTGVIEETINGLRDVAQIVAEASGKETILARFEKRVDIAVFNRKEVSDADSEKE